jgi:uncharacterized protein YcbK (DUF882 family)
MRKILKKVGQPPIHDVPPEWSRRRFLGSLALTLPSAVLLSPAVAQAKAEAARSLRLYHAHTGEELAITYYEQGEYHPDALAEANRFLRDFRTGEEYPIDRGLLDILHGIRQATGSNGRFEVVSGYRSPKTNAALRAKNSGVAKRSLHMQGRAIDVRLNGVDTARLRKAALALRGGGVGYYPKSGFVHLDTGRVRQW